MRYLLPALVSALLFPACAATPADDADSAEAAQSRAWSPYPDAVRPMQVQEPLLPQNVTLSFGDIVRDQGPIASCASHGFLALVENQLFLKRGVAIDLSERYQLFANFLETGNMGNQPAVIARYASVVERLGVLPEESYPYAAIAPNAVRFEADAAQGLHTDANAVTIDKAIEGTKDATKARADILTRAEYLGVLPSGKYPVTIPVKAKLLPNALVPSVEYGGKIAACFSADGAASAAADRRLALTPREFAQFCLGITPKPYFTCQAPSIEQTANAVEAEAPAPAPGDCAGTRALVDKIGAADADAKDRFLALTMSLLDRGQAVVVGVSSPAQAGHAALWPDVLPLGAGHAVLALGYLTAEELADVREHGRGMLGNGTFDRIASKIEPEYAAKLAAGLPNDPTALYDLRLASKLGKFTASEGGLLFFRNSWGEKLGDVEIGANGYQSMTFTYFAKSFMLMQSRTNPAIANVAWSTEQGACPTAIGVAGQDAWFSRPTKGRAVADALWSQAKPATCAP